MEGEQTTCESKEETPSRVGKREETNQPPTSAKPADSSGLQPMHDALVVGWFKMVTTLILSLCRVAVRRTEAGRPRDKGMPKWNMKRTVKGADGALKKRLCRGGCSHLDR